MGDDPSNKFVRVNSVRIGPDGNLWIVDIGSPGAGKADLPNGPKIVVVDLEDELGEARLPFEWAVGGAVQLYRRYPFPWQQRLYHRRGQLRRDYRHEPQTGDAYRTLVNDKSVMVQHPMMAEHKEMLDENANPLKINADQMEVSPDGKYYYYQACSGPLVPNRDAVPRR